MSKVITANDLTSGTVVFLGPDDNWVAALAEAVTFADDAAAEQGLARAQRDTERKVVEPFVSAVGADGDGRPAMSLRDRIRANGPTVRFAPADPAA